jgi:DNA ligase-1
MNAFTALIKALDSTTKTGVKKKALVRFFQESSDEDKLWAIALFTRKRPKRTVKTSDLRVWAAEMANIPLWLFEESYHMVGDLAETISLVVPDKGSTSTKSLSQWMHFILGLERLTDDQKKESVLNIWTEMDQMERFVFNKLITGGFRIGVSQKTLAQALSEFLSQDVSIVAHRLMGAWSPLKTTFKSLLQEQNPQDEFSKPYPFYLAYALENEITELGSPHLWQAEYKWDGIRGQIIVRKNEVFVWSRGEELVTEKYPEFDVLKSEVNDVVLDGEILAYANGKPLLFHDLQRRIGRKTVGKKLLNEVPVVFMAYDVLEKDGNDLRQTPLSERRKVLEGIVGSARSDTLKLSPLVEFNQWTDLMRQRELSREKSVEGIMLKQKNSTYQVGRKKGEWWKWKVDPLTLDAVLTYAQSGHGRRAGKFTDYTFGLWHGGELVTFAKAYSGLTNDEILEVDRFVKRNSLEKFGPVRRVAPKMVFELAFEGVAPSKRHKSGVAVRFPRIVRIRRDKPVEEANTLEDLKRLVP